MNRIREKGGKGRTGKQREREEQKVKGTRGEKEEKRAPSRNKNRTPSEEARKEGLGGRYLECGGRGWESRAEGHLELRQNPTSDDAIVGAQHTARARS